MRPEHHMALEMAAANPRVVANMALRVAVGSPQVISILPDASTGD
jgi:hypothetical protein